MTQGAVQRRFGRLAGAINQKARRVGAEGTIGPWMLAAVWSASSGKCEYCAVEVSPMGVSFDHRVPFSKGGQNVFENLAACCITCQRTKFTKTVAEFEEARRLRVSCEICGTVFVPRWADWQRGYGRTCSRKCSGAKGSRM